MILISHGKDGYRLVVGKLKFREQNNVYEENVYDKMRRKVGLPLDRSYVRYVMIYV